MFVVIDSRWQARLDPGGFHKSMYAESGAFEMN